MNTRERFVNTLMGEDVDRVPFIKVFGGTNAVHKHWEQEYPGIGTCIDKLLQFDGVYRGWGVTPVNLDPSNVGPSVVLKETGDIILRRRGDGTLDQCYKKGDYNRHTIEWPVKTRKDWDAYREKHLDPDDPSRFPANWAALAADYKVRDYPLQLTHRGVYGFARERMGDENLALAFYDDPELVHAVMNDYTDMALRVWEK
jgi:uroporphyrinogen decarboxylase